MAFIKSRVDPTTAPEMTTYRSLDSLSRVEVHMHMDRFYLMGCVRTDPRRDRPGRPVDKSACVFFGPLEGFETSAEAATALDLALTPLLTD